MALDNSPVARPQTLHCPNCGGPVERRGYGYTLTVGCPSCGAVLDASTPLFDVVQRFEKSMVRRPLIPLGARGKWNNVTWETIGYQVRGITVDGDHFAWEEYLLFNPYQGFRYLVQYEGHWNFVTPLESIPLGGGSAARLQGRTYKHFASSEPVTEFVIGEFPWRVRVGDRVRAGDFVAPPYVLSEESTGNETTWSEGVYVPGDEIWRAFQLPGSAPRAQGVYLNQPSPYTSSGPMWMLSFALIGVTLLLMLMFTAFSKRDTVLDITRSFAAGSTGEPSFVTQIFTLTGRPATIEVSTRTNLRNNWAYFGYSLINDDTGVAYDFGREVSYYSGSDSDGPWSEGSASDSVILPAVPAGRYYLRVEPEMEPGASQIASSDAMNFEIRLRHDVPTYTWFWIVIGLLLIPPVFRSLRAANFERTRWQESDHQPIKLPGGDDD